MTQPDPASDLPARLRLVVTRLARRLRQQSEASVSPTQIAALATIERHGPLTLGALAEAEGVQPPTITAAVDRLEHDGFVQREGDETDKRITRVDVTPAGRRLLDESRSRKTAYLAQRLDALTARDRATLERAAAILEQVLDDGDRRSEQP